MCKGTAIVTGATGFIGSNLAKRLVRENWDVHLIIRKTSTFEYIEDIINEVRFFEYDGNIQSLAKYFREIQPQMVFHLASLCLGEHNIGDIDGLVDSNIKFGTHILQAMDESKVKNIINTGTSWQHYNNDEYNPVNLYAATKQAFETILKYYTEAKGIKAITLELFDTYGPNDNRAKIINLLKRISIDNKSLDMSLGEQMLDIVYIDDVVEAYILAAHYMLDDEMLANNSRYSVCTKEPISLKKLVELFEITNDVKLNINWGARAYRNREVIATWDKGETLPGWEPEISLADGLGRLKNIKNKLES